MLFFISNTFKSKAKLKLTKNQTSAKQHPEVELLLLFTFFIMLSFKNNRTYSKRKGKENVCLYSWDYIFNHSENDDENEKLITQTRHK